MPIGDYGLRSDEQIQRSRMAAGEAEMQSGQAIGHGLATGAQAFMQSRAAAQEMQLRDSENTLRLQQHELSKQELVQKMAITQQMQGLRGQELQLQAAEFQLQKDKFAFSKEYQKGAEMREWDRYVMSRTEGNDYYDEQKGQWYTLQPDPSGVNKWGRSYRPKGYNPQARGSSNTHGDLKNALASIEEELKKLQFPMGSEDEKQKKARTSRVKQLEGMRDSIRERLLGGTGGATGMAQPAGERYQPGSASDVPDAMDLAASAGAVGAEMETAIPAIKNAMDFYRTEALRNGLEQEAAERTAASAVRRLLADKNSPLSRFISEHGKSLGTKQAQEPPAQRR